MIRPKWIFHVPHDRNIHKRDHGNAQRNLQKTVSESGRQGETFPYFSGHNDGLRTEQKVVLRAREQKSRRRTKRGT